MERLWAPWRTKYVTKGVRDPECLFCRILAAGQQKFRENLVLRATDRTVVMLNLYPYNVGHLLVAPYKHIRTPDELTAEDAAAFDEMLRFGIALVRKTFQPEGLNVGMNLGRVAGAGVPDHCHWHIVPRWSSDSNFMPVIGQTRVLPLSIDDVYERMAALL